MRVLSIVLLMVAGVAISGCWEDEKATRAKEFMSTLSKCDNCEIKKPFIGKPREDKAEDKAAK